MLQIDFIVPFLTFISLKYTIHTIACNQNHKQEKDHRCQIYHPLHETNRAKYLGVTIDNTLSWNSHIDIMTKKANNTTGAAFLSSCPADVKSRCYKTLVRPQLEYVATVWDPWTQTNISKIETVQRRVVRDSSAV